MHCTVGFLRVPNVRRGKDVVVVVVGPRGVTTTSSRAFTGVEIDSPELKLARVLNKE
jgi:hypothetical protein